MVDGGDGTKEILQEIKRISWRRRIGQLLRVLIHEHDSPQRLSIAIGLGVFIGTLPFFGLQTWMGILLALLMHLNKLATVLGTQISMPWFAPFLIAGSLQIGEWILHRRTIYINQISLDPGNLAPLFFSWLIGSLVLGAILGILSATLTFYIVKRLRKGKVNRSPFNMRDP